MPMIMIMCSPPPQPINVDKKNFLLLSVSPKWHIILAERAFSITVSISNVLCFFYIWLFQRWRDQITEQHHSFYSLHIHSFRYFFFFILIQSIAAVNTRFCIRFRTMTIKYIIQDDGNAFFVWKKWKPSWFILTADAYWQIQIILCVRTQSCASTIGLRSPFFSGETQSRDFPRKSTKCNSLLIYWGSSMHPQHCSDH